MPTIQLFAEVAEAGGPEGPAEDARPEWEPKMVNPNPTDTYESSPGRDPLPPGVGKFGADPEFLKWVE